MVVVAVVVVVVVINTVAIYSTTFVTLNVNRPF